MNKSESQKVARALLNKLGLPQAQQHSTLEAIEAHVREDLTAAAHWAAVQQELDAIASRPGAGDLDIYRLAKGLMGDRGSQEAWRHAMQQGIEATADLSKQAYWLRIADAVRSLMLGYDEEGA